MLADYYYIGKRWPTLHPNWTRDRRGGAGRYRRVTEGEVRKNGGHYRGRDGAIKKE